MFLKRELIPNAHYAKASKRFLKQVLDKSFLKKTQKIVKE